MKVVIFSLLFCVLFCGKEATLIRQPGNYTIAALLPIHDDPATCSDDLDFKSVVKTEAIIYAVNKVNSDPDLLNTLGYDVEDTCGEDAKQVLEKASTLLERHKGSPPVAFILDLPQLLGRLVAMYKFQDIPVLGLGDIPSQQGDVFYMVPGEPRLPAALVEYIQEFNWPVVDVLVVGNDKNYQSFVDAIEDVKICVGEVFRTPQMVATQNSSAPLLVFADNLDVLTNLPAQKDRKIVLANDRVLKSMTKGGDWPNAVTMQPKRAKLDDFKAHLLASARNNASWLGESLGREPVFRDCGGYGNESCITEVLDRLTSELEGAARAIDAVYVVAHALKTTSSEPLTNQDLSRLPEITSLTGNPIRFSENNDLFRVDYELHKLPSEVFIGTVKTNPETNEVDMDIIERGRISDNPAISNCEMSCPEGTPPVPMTGPLAKCCVTCPEVNSTACNEGERFDLGKAKCVVVRLDYLRWSHPFSIIIMVLVGLFFCLLVFLVNLYVKKAHMPTISVSPLATVPLLLSIFLTLILPLLPILKPSTTACNVYTFGFVQGLGVPLCILISRSCSVYRRFRTDDGTLRKKCCHGDPENVIAVVLIIVQLVLTVVFICEVPAHVAYYPTNDPYVDYIECSMFNGWEFLFPFFWTIILTIIFTVKNFRAATREEDTYESHFVALSISGYYFLSFLLLIVLYAVSGKVKIILVCVISLFYSVNYFMLIFFPKLYVVVFQRDPKKFSPYPLPVKEERYDYVLGEDEVVISEDIGLV